MAFDFGIFWGALTSWAFVNGALITVALALSAHTIAIVLAIPGALLANGPSRLGRAGVATYVWLFRGAPTLLQLLFIWNVLPQIFPIFRDEWFTPFLASLIALSLNETAYQSEINRAALTSVDKGQKTAGMTLGMTRFQIFRYIVMPQAMRIAVPPTANEFITLLKLTSLASVISLRELLTVTSQTVAVTFRFLEMYSAALVYYMAIVSVLMWGQSVLEKRLNPSSGGRARIKIEHRS